MDILDDLQNQFLSYYDQLAILIPKMAIGLVMVLSLGLIIKAIRVRVVAYLHKKADDKLLINFFNSMIRFINVVLLGLLFLYTVGLGKIAGTVLGAAGITAFVIGFALKDIGENFLAGVIMAFDRPFKMGDVIKTGDVEGTIVEMSLRDIHVKTFDGKDVYVPNGQIIKIPLYNYTIDGFIRQDFTVGVDYNTDLAKARSIILDTVSQIPGVLSAPKNPKTFISLLNTNTIDIQCQYWLDTTDKRYSGTEIKSQTQIQCIKEFEKAGIKIPSQIIELGGEIKWNKGV